MPTIITDPNDPNITYTISSPDELAASASTQAQLDATNQANDQLNQLIAQNSILLSLTDLQNQGLITSDQVAFITGNLTTLTTAKNNLANKTNMLTQGT